MQVFNGLRPLVLLMLREGFQYLHVLISQEVRLQQIGLHGLLGEIRCAALEVVESPAEDQLLENRIVVEALAQRRGQVLEIPSTAGDQHLSGVPRLQVPGHSLLADGRGVGG